MKNLKFISLIITLSAVFTLYFSLHQEKLFALPLDPKITFEDHHHDFGRVEMGVDLNCKFYFRNSGTAKLIILFTGDMGGSDLITAKLISDKKEFEPGESGEIIVSCNSGYMAGEQDMAVEVISNDLENEHFSLVLHFDVAKYQN